MVRIDFLISNDGHHPAIFRPVIDVLALRSDFHCRVISLCEFRGLVSPVEQFRMDGVEFVQVLPTNIRRSSSTGKQTGKRTDVLFRNVARKLSWLFLLRRPFHRIFGVAPNLVLLANDSAFPYDQICRLLHAKGIPYFLVQEGIRFKVPAGRDFDEYGRSGSLAVAAWGEMSVGYFRRQGVPKERIFSVGSPRFDMIPKTNRKEQAEKLKAQLQLDSRTLLFLSNPIDDQGYCTTKEKWALIRRFVSEIGSLLAQDNFRLVIKLHGRESTDDLERALFGLPSLGRIVILKNVPLYQLFVCSGAAIVLASSVGLEALLFDLPLGVLEIPGFGFAYNYVQEHAGVGLQWRDPMVGQVENLFTLCEDVAYLRSVSSYLKRSLETRENATERLISLIDSYASESQLNLIGCEQNG